MQIYLPIAELPVNMFMLFGMGGAVGFLSGLFGIGGGFLLTPLLIFSGIPPAVSVATVTTQVVASSASGVVAYWRRKMIDFKLAGMLLVGGIVRDEEFIPPKPEEIIRQGDRVVLLSHSDFVKKAEKLFSVGVGVF